MTGAHDEIQRHEEPWSVRILRSTHFDNGLLREHVLRLIEAWRAQQDRIVELERLCASVPQLVEAMKTHAGSQSSGTSTRNMSVNGLPRVVVASYVLPDQSLIERCPRRDGSVTWAVRSRDGCCLNRDGHWEHDPLHSHRDEGFLVRCRFDSPEQAYEAWISRHGGAS